MRPTKWVQSIECGGDECFICLLLFLTRQQIFLLFLGLFLMAFSIGPRHPEDMSISSRSLVVIVSLYLWWVVCIFRRTYCQCFPRSVLLTLALSHLSIFSDSCPPIVVVCGFLFKAHPFESSNTL